jgi:hypothetical protein
VRKVRDSRGYLRRDQLKKTVYIGLADEAGYLVHHKLTVYNPEADLSDPVLKQYIDDGKWLDSIIEIRQHKRTGKKTFVVRYANVGEKESDRLTFSQELVPENDHRVQSLYFQDCIKALEMRQKLEREADGNDNYEWPINCIYQMRIDPYARRQGNMKKQYRVRWKYYSATEDTWEPEDAVNNTQAYTEFNAPSA